MQLLASAANTSLARAQLTEVLRGAGNDVLAQLHDAAVTGNIIWVKEEDDEHTASGRFGGCQLLTSKSGAPRCDAFQ